MWLWHSRSKVNWDLGTCSSWRGRTHWVRRLLKAGFYGAEERAEWWIWVMGGECGREIREAEEALRYDAREVKKQAHKAKHNFIFWGLNLCLYVWWWGHHWPLRDTFLELLLWNEVAADSGVGGLEVEVEWRVTVLAVWHEDCSQRESSAEKGEE